jgi:hypothetical protein
VTTTMDVKGEPSKVFYPKKTKNHRSSDIGVAINSF